jgi:hypothetical protein
VRLAQALPVAVSRIPASAEQRMVQLGEQLRRLFGNGAVDTAVNPVSPPVRSKMFSSAMTTPCVPDQINAHGYTPSVMVLLIVPRPPIQSVIRPLPDII